jgi:serine/threonine protein kinase
MRDVQHENLVKFIGMCTDEPNIAIVNELNVRGTLRDMIENESMKIDWVFRYSMITDIVEGMIFVHNSNIEFHGRLKSSNLQIDGRFMVKIADYGMRSLHKQVDREEAVNPREMFWTAPGKFHIIHLIII